VGLLKRLVDDLLDVSRINTGRIRLQKEYLDLREVVELAVEATRSLTEERGHAVRATVPSEPVWVLADRVRMEQLLVNLMTNAAKYTDEGGTIEVALAPHDGEAVIRVSDNGIGIAPELLPRVFELFTQAHRTPDRKQGGLGVGLTVVRRVAEMHGGRVEASSPGLGLGSVFAVTIPVSAPTTELLPFPLAESHAEAPHLRVLVVDDNEDTANTVALLLRHAGHEVELAHSGQSALEAALSFHPAAVILDLGLPGMDGYEVARRIRENPDLRNVRLIAVSGYAQEADRRRSADAGVDIHLAKPVEPGKIQEILADLR
jgi:CheY-like chemotaxis protein/two-component sensor histidine kinase